MPWLTEDRTRLDRFRRGEAAALADTYDVYALALAQRLAKGVSVGSGAERWRLGQPFDVAEVVQETFVRAFAEPARQRYDGVRPFSNYLLTIARNLIVDEHRSQIRHARWQQRERSEAGMDAEAAAQPDSSLIDDELREVYAAFLAGLDETGRQLCRMRFEEQLPRRDVCDATGLSLMQVRHQEQRLRARLYRLLVAAGYGELHAVCLLGLLMPCTGWLELA